MIYFFWNLKSAVLSSLYNDLISIQQFFLNLFSFPAKEFKCSFFLLLPQFIINIQSSLKLFNVYIVWPSVWVVVVFCVFAALVVSYLGFFHVERPICLVC